MLEIHIPVVNNPEFIEIQYHLFKKFCKDDWKMIIFNDAKDWHDPSNFEDLTLKRKIKEVCDKLEIEHHFIPNQNHKNILTPSIRHCLTANYIFQNFQKDNKNSILIFDSDMFPFKEFSIKNFIGHDIVGVLQKRKTTEFGEISYLWPNLMFFTPSKLKNLNDWDWSVIISKEGIFEADTGGNTFKYLQKNPDLKIKNISHLSSGTWNKKDCTFEIPIEIQNFLDSDIRNKDNKYYSEIYDNWILHLRASSNWENLGRSTHLLRTKLLKKFINSSS
jgi:hypothetical protein